MLISLFPVATPEAYVCVCVCQGTLCVVCASISSFVGCIDMITYIKYTTHIHRDLGNEW